MLRCNKGEASSTASTFETRLRTSPTALFALIVCLKDNGNTFSDLPYRFLLRRTTVAPRGEKSQPTPLDPWE
jgi:hypothetical protein